MEPQLAAPRVPVLSVALMMFMSAALGAVWARSAYAFIAEREEPAVSLLRRPRSPPRPPPRLTARPLPPPPSAVQCPSNPAIRWTGTRYDVARAIFENPPSAGFGGHTPRIVPSVGNGRPRGFKVYAIRPCSLPEQLGLRNGDLVVSINGVEPLTPDSLLASFKTLRKAKDFTVRIERQGKPVTQLYHLYDAPQPRRAVGLHRGGFVL